MRYPRSVLAGLGPLVTSNATAGDKTFKLIGDVRGDGYGFKTEPCDGVMVGRETDSPKHNDYYIRFTYKF